MKYEKPEFVGVPAIAAVQTTTMNKSGSFFTDNQQRLVPPTNAATSAAYEADE